MNPGLFNKRITIEAPPDPNQTNENGFPTEEWDSIIKAWCWIKTPNDKGGSYEFYEGAATHSQNTCSFVIRYFKGLNSKMRIIYNQRVFEIISCINDNEANKTWTIVGKEVI